MGDLLKLIWKIAGDASATLGAAIVTRTPLTVAIIIDLIELALLARFIGEVTWKNAFYLEVFEEEVIKLAEALAEAAEDDAADQQRIKREQEEQHRILPFLFGKFNIWDAYLLARSGYKVYNSGIPQSVYQALSESEIAETIGELFI